LLDVPESRCIPTGKSGAGREVLPDLGWPSEKKRARVTTDFTKQIEALQTSRRIGESMPRAARLRVWLA
jgi:hypothetical protein